MSILPKLYGLPRSGGTLIYNIVDHIFDGKVNPQSHKYFKAKSGDKVIIIYRDFRDSCVSYWRTSILDARGNGFDSISEIKTMGLFHMIKCIFRYKRFIKDLNKFFKDIDIIDCEFLFLKYEDFFDDIRGDVDFDFIFTKLECFLNISIQEYDKKYIRKMYCFDSQKEESSNYVGFHGDGSLNSGWNENRHIHGHHLFTGLPGTWKLLVPSRYQSMFNFFFIKDLKFYGYK